MKTILQLMQLRMAIFSAALLTGIVCTRAAFATVPPDTSSSRELKAEGMYLELKGVVTGARNFLQEAEILVFEEDNVSLYTTELTNRMGRATIQLPLNREFTLVFSKSGFISKRLKIDTHLQEASGVFIFKYSVELYEYVEGLDAEILKKPVGVVTFSKKHKKFDYDDAYTALVNDELRSLYERYYSIKKEEQEQ